MLRKFATFFTILTVFALGQISYSQAETTKTQPLNIVTTIPPVYGLTKLLIQDLADVEILSQAGASPHGRNLRPSDIRRIKNADLVIQIGPTLESSIDKALTTHAKDKVLVLEKTPNLINLPIRENGIFLGSGNAGHHDHHDHGAYDPHIWLNPKNGKAILQHMAKYISNIAPHLASQLEANRQEANNRLDNLIQEIENNLANISSTKYVVFHDAYQHFETNFDLAPIATIMTNPERKPGARHIANLLKLLRDEQVACLFKEPQFKSNLINSLNKNGNFKVIEIDPIGYKIPLDQDLYFKLIGNVTISFKRCL